MVNGPPLDRRTMTWGQGEDADDPIAGLRTVEAVRAVLARAEAAEDARDPEAVRAALDRVTEDGVVSWDAADDALAHASKVVSTPETRLEFAAAAVEDAEGAARSVPDLDVVRARIEDLKARLSTVETRVAELAESLQGLVRRCQEREDLYTVARGIAELTAESDRLHGIVEDLRMDAEKFETWLGSHDVRLREFEGDVDAVVGSMDELSEAVDRLADAAESRTGDVTQEAEPERDVESGAVWFDANLRRRVTELLVADLRAELDALRTLADREDTGPQDRTDEVKTRLDYLDARITSVADRLDALAEPAWREQYGDRLEAFDAAIEEFEPPVDWGEVQATLETHRGDVSGGESTASEAPE